MMAAGVMVNLAPFYNEKCKSLGTHQKAHLNTGIANWRLRIPWKHVVQFAV
jgi:hypothetical protein